MNATPITTYLYNALNVLGVELKTLSNTPKLGVANFNGIDGYYFTRKEYGNWTDTEMKIINFLMPFKIDGKVVTLHSIDQMDFDGDRHWHASFTFSLTQDYDQLAERFKASKDYEQGKRLY